VEEQRGSRGGTRALRHNTKSGSKKRRVSVGKEGSGRLEVNKYTHNMSQSSLGSAKNFELKVGLNCQKKVKKQCSRRGRDAGCPPARGALVLNNEAHEAMGFMRAIQRPHA